MNIHRFGQFLIEHQAVSEKEVLDALNIQRKERFPLGQLAIAEQMLTEEQVLQILNAQIGTSRRFRELAVDLKLLSEAQVVTLLAVQEEQNLPLGAILVRQGRLTQERCNQLLNEFHRRYARPGQSAPVATPP